MLLSGGCDRSMIRCHLLGLCLLAITPNLLICTSGDTDLISALVITHGVGTWPPHQDELLHLLDSSWLTVSYSVMLVGDDCGGTLRLVKIASMIRGMLA